MAATLPLPRPYETEHGVFGGSPETIGMRRSRALGVSANRITLLRDADGRAEVKETFLAGLNQPFGMALLGERLYVANTDGVLVFPYPEGQTRIEGEGRKLLDLPAGGYNNHWTRNIAVKPDGKKLYVAVGSASNVGEYGMAEEERRACILEIDPDGGERIFASGLRNPVGLDWEPATGAMWTARLVEPGRVLGLQGGVRSLREWPPERSARGLPDRLHRRRRHERGLRPALWCGGAARRCAAGGGRRRRRRLAGGLRRRASPSAAAARSSSGDRSLFGG
jgi:hypothetical protein